MVSLERDGQETRQMRERLERAEEALASLRGEVAQLRRRLDPLTPEVLERLMVPGRETPSPDPRRRHGTLPVRNPL